MRFRKNFKNYSSGDGINTIDLTAMTDIIFILLIFFILTSNVAQNVFDFEIPKADENLQQFNQSNFQEVKISLFTNGEFAVEDKKFKDYKIFTNFLQTSYFKNKDTEFLLIIENTLPINNLIKLLTFFKSQDITKVDILIETK